MFGLECCYNYVFQLPHPSSDGAQEKATHYHISTIVNVIIIQVSTTIMMGLCTLLHKNKQTSI